MENKMTTEERWAHGNYRPEGWIELDEKEFREHYFFHYIMGEHDFRQIYYDEEITGMGGLFDAKLFPLKYKTLGDLGVAIVSDWKAKKLTFFRYGNHERWSKFESAFAAQFAGDNS